MLNIQLLFIRCNSLYENNCAISENPA